MDVRVVILAGGEGIRFADGGQVPKISQLIEGKPVIAHSIDTLKELKVSEEDIDVIIGGEFADEFARYLEQNYRDVNVMHYSEKGLHKRGEREPSLVYSLSEYLCEHYAPIQEELPDEFDDSVKDADFELLHYDSSNIGTQILSEDGNETEPFLCKVKPTQEDVLVLLNADSVYTEKSLKEALESSEQALEHKGYAGIIYNLKTLEEQ